MHALLRADEIAYVVRDSGAKALICAAPLLPEGGKGAAVTDTPLSTVTQEEGQERGDPPRLDALAESATPIER